MESSDRRHAYLPRFRRAALILLVVVGSFTPPITTIAQQAADAPVVYSRTLLRIHPFPPPPAQVIATAPSQEAEKNSPSAQQAAQAVEPGQPIEITADIRPLSYLKNPGMYLTAPLLGEQGILVPLPQRDLHQIERANVYAPMDIFVINYQGVITQIYPEFVLNNLGAPVAIPGDTAAVLYLPSGFTEKWGIKPQFMVEHPIFTPPPQILQ